MDPWQKEVVEVMASSAVEGLLESIRLPDFSVYSIDFVADSSPHPFLLPAQ